MLAVRGGNVLPVAILHNTTPEEAETLAQRLSSIFPQERMHRAKFGPVMGTYVGPDCLGIALVEAER